MQKTIVFKRQAFFIAAMSLTLAAGCTNSSNLDNSKTAVWYKNAPTPAPSVAVGSSPVPSLPPSQLPENSPAPATSPSPTIVPAPTMSPASANSSAVALSSEKLMIPVMGIKGEELRDTFRDARSENRVHDAIDIMAASGTPIVAATTGKIVKFFDSVKGGITIYELSPDERTVYYYAHLERRADNLREGETVAQGALLGYVGDTGNAGAGNTHLHFAIWTITDPKKYFDGENINPYPLLKDGIVKPQ